MSPTALDAELTVGQMFTGPWSAVGVPFLLFALLMPNNAKRRKAPAKDASKP